MSHSLSANTRQFPRHVRPILVEAMTHARIVFVGGARQVGKTTLMRSIIAPDGERPMLGVTLDDPATRLAATDDPVGFVAGLGERAFIDEVHRAPDLLLALKDEVDRHPAPGRFVITGSANVLASRRIVDALPGRIDRVDMWPLSQAEILGATDNLVDALFDGRPPVVERAAIGPDAYAQAVTQGGFPEARSRPPGRVRDRWFRDYIEGTLARDLPALADIRRADDASTMLRLLAAQSSGLLNYRAIGSKLEMDAKTVKAYVALLEQMFLLRRLPVWRAGLSAREGSTPKVHICDAGLLSHLLGADEERVRQDEHVRGRVCESFVVAELVQHLSWSRRDARVFHYQRDRGEVDVILEDRSGHVVAVEVKASATLGRSDTRTLAQIRDRLGDRFVCGVVVHAGSTTTPLGDRLWALPFAGLWA